MQVNLLKKIDGSFGKLLAGLIPSPRPSGVCRFDRMLIVRPGGIGDAVHLVPTLALLKERFPACEIDVLVERRNREVLRFCPYLNKVFLYDRFLDMFQLMRCRYDVIIDTEQWYRLSAIVTRFICSNWKIGFSTNERRRLFTHKVDYSHQEYEAFSFYNLLAPLGILSPQEIPGKFLFVPDSAMETASKMLSGDRDKKFIAMFPFASIPERRWQEERFREVAQWCLDQGLGVVLIGGGGDRQASERISCGLEIINLVGQMSLVASAAVMERAALVLSGDSGPLHIAVGLDRPTVSLFGPGIEDKWAPLGTKHRVLNKRLSCSPCTKFGRTPPCPIDVECMRQLSTQDVILAVEGLLKKA